jgi:predicted ATPase
MPGEVACIDAVVANPGGSQPLRHILSFRSQNQSFSLDDERIENREPYGENTDPYIYYRYQHGHPILNIAGQDRRLSQETVEPDKSILAQRHDPETYPEVSYLASLYKKIRVYREWSFGRNAVFRQPQSADMRNDRLEEDFSNLGLFLNRMRRLPQTKNTIRAALRDLYEGLDDFDVSIEGGTVQVFFTEGDFVIPANRLSDGTLRYLCLLAILCDPEPPPLICIEEPELGLHPDVLPRLADLLIKAAERTQLIVTTHSDIIVDALSEMPEAVLVCEKQDHQTVMTRLDAGRLQKWLEKYKLGQLWLRGEIGGTRF